MWESWAPVGRLGWPEDQARVALFLASDMSAYVTGHNIPVDGGTKAGGGWFWSPSARRFTKGSGVAGSATDRNVGRVLIVEIEPVDTTPLARSPHPHKFSQLEQF